MANNREQSKLTAWFESRGITDYWFTDREGFASVDAFFSFQNRRYCVEAKIRTGKVDTYPTHILEKVKYDEFVRLSKEGYKPLLALFFEDGIICYNVAQRLGNLVRGEYSQLDFQDMRLPANSMKQRGTKIKQVAHLRLGPGFADRVYPVASVVKSLAIL